MASPLTLEDPWLVAAWPGMGHVGVGAAAHLIEGLRATHVHELPADEFFDVMQVSVEGGVARRASLPRSMFFEWHGTGTHDLLIFVGEAQPPASGYAMCRRLLDYAVERGVRRVFTFAAMATQLHPSAQPRVFAAVTEAPMLAEIREFEVEILQDGQIGGLNGLLLAAAAERGLPGACLLGEMPFFAAGVQNPKASLAVLEVFSQLMPIEIDLAELRHAGDEVEGAMLALLENMKAAAREKAGDEDEDDEFETSDDDALLDPASEARIEKSFAEAERDRGKAFELKELLDRLGVFAKYENRFLDLFKQGE